MNASVNDIHVRNSQFGNGNSGVYECQIEDVRTLPIKCVLLLMHSAGILQLFTFISRLQYTYYNCSKINVTLAQLILGRLKPDKSLLHPPPSHLAASLYIYTLTVAPWNRSTHNNPSICTYRTNTIIHIHESE